MSRRPLYATVWRDGVIRLSDDPAVPQGALALIHHADGRRLKAIAEVVARHARTGDALLVPGVPEAESHAEALEAVERFRSTIELRLATTTGGRP